MCFLVKLNSETTMEAAERIRITEINIECLEIAFKYLSLDDLLNVANTNTHLRNAAKLAFASKYRKKRINVQWTESIPGIADEGYLKMSLRMLRCFGELISSLEVSCYFVNDKSDTFLQRLLDYVSEYCATSLTELVVNRCPKGAWDRVQTPFQSVRNVFLNSSRSIRGDNLNRLFPEMRQLNLGYLCSVYPLTDLDHHYPNMEEINISDDPAFFLNCNETDAFESFFRLNPQIRSLKMPFMTHAYLQHVNKHLLLLENFELIYKGHLPDTIGEKISFKSVISFKVHSTGDKLPLIPITFNDLRVFSLDIRSLKDNRTLYEFLNEYPTVQKLSIKHNMLTMSEKNINIFRLLATLPLLSDLDLRFWKFTPDKAIYVMKNAKHLKRFFFMLFKVSEYVEIQSRVAPEWRGSTPFAFNSVYRFIRE